MDYTAPEDPARAARPITFMQSAAKLKEGTSLALADYFGYNVLHEDEEEAGRRYTREELEEACGYVPKVSSSHYPSNMVRPESFFHSINT